LLTADRLRGDPPQPVSAGEFATLLDALGPFGERPVLGLAVSGGADSLALASLAQAWVQNRGGQAQAFIVDHGLRDNSRAEVEQAAMTLGRLGIAARILTLTGLAPGPGLSERARVARYRVLAAACREAGIIHLLLGHHAADQAETLLMRSLRGSGEAGLAGMAALSETEDVRLIRPLLSIPPGRLRATLRASGTPWAEDPTNADLRFTRARLRALRADADGLGPATRALTDAASLYGARRHEAERAEAGFLAAHAMIRPEGFVLLSANGPWPARALGRLLRMVTGAHYAPDPGAVMRIAGDPSGVIGGGLSLGGARLMPAGRLGGGFLICREEAAMAPPIPALPRAVWDRRFRWSGPKPGRADVMVGGLGDDSARFRELSDLPSAVLRTLPALRDGRSRLLAVPGLGWHAEGEVDQAPLVFAPVLPAVGAAFVVESRADTPFRA
jgi:tRNA(Ile)-lysidine synthase